MKYVILVSHGTFAHGLKSAVLMMSGQRDDILSTSLEEGMGTNEFAENFAKLVEPITHDDEILLFSDILSGSPFTTSIEVLNQKNLFDKTTVFAGMNMPMVLTAVLMKDNLEKPDLIEATLSEGKLGVTLFEINAVNFEEEEL
ncbi:MAG: PTS fructose transporter subunit IIA [Erysipelotrichaceae bacterium]|jgi:PTS system N-acetylgalactosamine-specific IIA component|nr:PTS fructose transporter subunit IIA [Erysipelotrichaceae bacterium]